MGLVYVDAAMPGLTRVRHGRAFGYRDAAGRRLQDKAVLARIRSLAIPPAYTQVWICPLPNGHLQATGLDAKGRRQYRYHADWRRLRDAGKFERLEAFGRALPRIRRQVERDLQAGARLSVPDRQTVVAALVHLLDTTFMRVGHEEYVASNGSYGLTTVRQRHAKLEGSQLTLRFRGKSGVEQSARVDDPRIARLVRRCQQLPGQELFRYEGQDGASHAVDSGQVNDYLAEAGGDGYTAKDFRTWHGSVLALELTRLACRTETARKDMAAMAILKKVASQLGNTPAVCRKAYVHPEIMALGTRLLQSDDPALEGIWDTLGSRTSPRGLSAAERRLLVFLAQGGRVASAAGG